VEIIGGSCVFIIVYQSCNNGGKHFKVCQPMLKRETDLKVGLNSTKQSNVVANPEN
jgi:hypothetical protein